jgi:hypothetical protein
MAIWFPVSWTNRLLSSGASGSAWIVAALLLRQRRAGHKRTIRLANTSIEQKRKWRGLTELEKLGLVRIDRRGPRKSPDVALLNPEETQAPEPRLT